MSLLEIKKQLRKKRAHRRRRERRIAEWQIPVLNDVAALSQLTQIDSQTLWWLASEDQQCKYKNQPRRKPTEHYHRWWIRKRSDGWRLVEAPKSTLKSAQRAILESILDCVPLHPLSFGFTKGRSVLDFTKPHCRRDCCLRLDLRDFFPSINAGRVYGLFRSLNYNRAIARLLTLLTTTATPGSTLSLHDAFDTQHKYKRRHLPQGAPTSPALANLCAYRLDARVSGLARSIGGVHYTRYADDMLLSGNANFARRANQLAITVGAIALEEGFDLNFRKTRVMRSSQRQQAAGMVMNDGPNLSRKKFDELKATLYNCIRFEPNSQNLEGHNDFRAHLEGRVAWVTRLRPARGEKLRRMLHKIDWN